MCCFQQRKILKYQYFKLATLLSNELCQIMLWRSDNIFIYTKTVPNHTFVAPCFPFSNSNFILHLR